MLVGKQMEAFSSLATPSPLRALQRQLGVTQGATSKVVASLARQGLVVRPTQKNASVRVSDHVHAAALARLLQEYPRIDWNRLLSAASIRLLGVLVGPPKALEARIPARDPPRWRPLALEEASRLGRRTMWRWLAELGHVGIVIRRDGTYAYNPRHATLARFVSAYWAYQNQHVIRRVAGPLSIVWERGPEFLARGPRDLKEPDLHPTGPSVMAAAGLPLIMKDAYWFHGPKPDAQEAIVHTWLADPTNPTFAAYAILFDLKAPQSGLLRTAQAYGVRSAFEAMKRWKETRGKESTQWLPASKDFEALRKQYGVEV